MLHDFIQQYAKLWNQQSSISAKINVLNIPNLLFTELGIPASDFDEETIIPDIILSRGYQSCFSGWRKVPMSFISHKNFLSQIPTVCLVRDPRDCVVSAYFSFLKSHCLPKDVESKLAQKILDERKLSQNMTIDDWVLGKANQFFDELSR